MKGNRLPNALKTELANVKIKSESEQIIKDFEIDNHFVKLAIHRAVVGGYAIAMEICNESL